MDTCNVGQDSVDGADESPRFESDEVAGNGGLFARSLTILPESSLAEDSSISCEEGVKERMNVVVVGHVDHGKSTVVGRLLADTHSLPEGKLEQVKAKCDAVGKRFEYAFLLDALVDEQSQGITIDTARIFFQSALRHYIILDAPGHIEFLRNMVTGASHAEAALLVIDAEEGVKENSRRHGYMLSLLGVKHLIVLINKMDLVDYSQSVFEKLVQEYSEFLAQVGSTADQFIPVTGLLGGNIAHRAEAMPWYHGRTVLEALDNLVPAKTLQDNTLRLYVQDVYKFTKYGDARRIIAGTIDSGTLRPGDDIVFYPSGKRTTVRSIESFNTPPQTVASAGEAVGITMSEQLYVCRGELATVVGQRPPVVSTRAQVSLFWLGRDSLKLGEEFTIKVGTTRTAARIEQITKIVDAGTLEQNVQPTAIERNNVAECVLRFSKPIAFDEVEFLSGTSRFVVVHNYRIWGGGIIRKGLSDQRSQLREQVMIRNEKWIHSLVSPWDRATRYAQKPSLILITGSAASPRRELGLALEARLFQDGRTAYFLGIGNILHGLDSDIEGASEIGQEHIRRVAELANIMLDAGLLLVVSAADLTGADVALIQELVGAERVKTAAFGATQDELRPDISLSLGESLPEAVEKITTVLAEARIIFQP